MNNRIRGSVAAGVLAGLVTGIALAQGATGLEAAQSDKYGHYLADADGRAVYLFTADTRGEGNTPAASSCYDECAGAWPPLVATDEVSVGDNLRQDLVGEAQRRDGTMQVTYAGWPLYYFVKDAGTGEVQGQDIHSFGGEWYLVSPDGSKNEQASKDKK